MPMYKQTPILISYSDLEDKLVADRSTRKFKDSFAEWVEGDSPTAQTWVKQVEGLLDEILKRSVGRMLMAFLPANSRILITQYDLGDVKKFGECNAYVTPISPAHVRLSFSPKPDEPCAHPSLPGSQPHEVLFHELVHAYRHLSTKGKGKMSKLTGAVAKYYDNTEEWLSVMVTNMYMSEYSTKLRSHHHGFALLPSEMSTSEGFVNYKGMRKVFDFMNDEDGNFMRRLSMLGPPRFNPLKAYYE